MGYRSRSAAILVGLSVCSGVVSCGADSSTGVPELAPADAVLTTVRPSRQDMSNKVSLTGRVVMNPVFGLVAPEDGRLEHVAEVRRTASRKAVTVAYVVNRGGRSAIKIPAGEVFAGWLAEDEAKVTAGMPVVAARHTGYGLTADVDADNAYRLGTRVGTVRAQIKNGPGPFECAAIGTIAALPPGLTPEPPKTEPPVKEESPRPTALAVPSGPDGGEQASEPTGMRLNCVPPGEIVLINGAGATLEIESERRARVLVVPVEAVAGRQGHGKVDVVGSDGARNTTDVGLGMSDGKMIEITSGLTGDETLAVPGPALAKPDKKSDEGAGGAPSAGPR